MSRPLRARIAAARVAAPPAVAERARAGLLAYVEAMAAHGTPPETALAEVARGKAATGIARVALSGMAEPAGLACAKGCAFCCILGGEDGATITEAEARALHDALRPLAGRPDGRAWHPKACPALDPETRVCRAYDARPVICRSYVSTDAAACERVADGVPAPGPGTLGPYHTYLAALGLSRAALKGVRRVPTHALSRLAAAAVEGAEIEDALAASRHKPGALDEELSRSKRDRSRAGLP